MTIYEYGDRSKPHILLIHGMWMIHEMILPYVDKLRDDYHIIAPDLTRHGSDTGRFESAQKEASEIVDWLVQNQMTELALVFGASLGGVIAMDVISNETVLHQKADKNVLLVLPTDDKAFSEEAKNELIEIFPDAVVTMVHGGHTATLYKVEPYVKSTQRFIEERL